jgi:hypothetical protein
MGCFHGDIPYFLNFPTESFIVPTADLSAIGGGFDIPLHMFISIIGPRWLFRYSHTNR